MHNLSTIDGFTSSFDEGHGHRSTDRLRAAPCDLITLALAGSAFVLLVMVPVIWIDLDVAYGNRTTPGDEVGPGLVALICGLALVVAGVALVR